MQVSYNRLSATFGLFTADEASNYLTLECIETKAKKHMMDALYNIGNVYKKAGFKVKKARTDGEPAFADRRKDIEDYCGWEVSHCQPYCHNKPVERAIRTVRGKFGAIIHNSECPIPAFLYKYVLMHVVDCCNRTFNVKNAGLVPYEQLHPGEQALDLEDIIKHKFGKLVGFHNPKAEFSDSSRCDYGIQVGRDKSRPNCILVYKFTGEPCVEPKSEVWETVWTPELKKKYLDTCGDSIASDLPAFLNEEGSPVGPADGEDETTNDSDGEEDDDHDMIVSPTKRQADTASNGDMDSSPTKTSPPGITKSCADIFREELESSQPTSHKTGSAGGGGATTTGIERLIEQEAARMAEMNVVDRGESTWNEMLSNPALAAVNDRATLSAINNLVTGTDLKTAQTIASRIKERGRQKSKSTDRILNLSIKQAVAEFNTDLVDEAVLVELQKMPDKDVWDFITPADLTTSPS